MFTSWYNLGHFIFLLNYVFCITVSQKFGNNDIVALVNILDVQRKHHYRHLVSQGSLLNLYSALC